MHHSRSYYEHQTRKTTTATLEDGKVILLGPDTMLAVRYMLAINDHQRAPALILAIKFVRLRHGIGLKDAKDIVDAMRDDRSIFD